MLLETGAGANVPHNLTAIKTDSWQPKCCTGSAVQEVLHRKCCTESVVQEVLFRKCCTASAVQEVLYRKCCTGSVEQKVLYRKHALLIPNPLS